MGREFELRKEVVLPVSPEEVWAAVATPEGQAAWFMTAEEIGPDGAEVWDPPKHLVIKTPPGEDGSFHAFEYLIEGREGSAVLRFVHSGMSGDAWPDEYVDMTEMGWDCYLHSLREYLVHFGGRPAVYVEADGPASSTEWDAWNRFVERLGVAEAGDEVSLSVAGLPSQDGVVDIIRPGFVGIRTQDSLVRFHCRVPLGMPVAVGHHVYRPIDTGAYTEAWKAWLHSNFS
ncbi:SRPBCC domain-containing protein [Allokutzneria sp. A3M-2-11 16]|uniref:SRPBCC family protein n=1 Tax=Allokutzneria sp. A3M-2-11 16 TaxID=2962043 RepID=UPI0020B64298|nr:SRPBCC domain-containing protein [Allokutzneria sp. A3M-2-11 16]MCP3805259.1 SRPBCC domain-containing protein [Allokutzneria sp. A3M-2-11 16]